MEKFNEIIEGLFLMVKNEPNVDLINYVRFLNNEYAKIKQSSKAEFIKSLEVQYKSLEIKYLSNNLESKQIPNYEFQFFYTIQYFFIKETITFEWLQKQISKIKKTLKRVVFSNEFHEIKVISQQLSIMPQEQKRIFLLERHKELLKEFNNKSNFKKGFYNPLFEDISIYMLLNYQKGIKNKLDLFWLPMPCNENLKDYTNSTVGEVLFYSVSPVLELFFSLEWINNQLEPKQEGINEDPLIDINHINLYYSQYLQVMPKDEVEPIEVFTSRFYKDIKCSNPIVPKRKPGRSSDEYKNARKWLKIMVKEISEEIRTNCRGINYANWVRSAFDFAYRNE